MRQMQALLTPYDTGERLEPRPWVQGGLNMAQLVRQAVGGQVPASRTSAGSTSTTRRTAPCSRSTSTAHLAATCCTPKT